MKIKNILRIGLILFLGLHYAQGQDLMESVKAAAKQYNEQYPEDKNTKEMDPETGEKAEKWKKQWEDAKDAAKEGMAYFDTKELNCLFLMVLYLDGYFKLEDEADATASCTVKYDLYGIQASAIALSTTIMYCPEHLYNLSDAEFEDFVENQLTPLLHAEASGLEIAEVVKLWIASYRRVGKRLSKLYEDQKPHPNEDPEGYEAYNKMPHWKAIKDLTFFFSPQYVVLKSLEIGKKMEALGCGDY